VATMTLSLALSASAQQSKDAAKMKKAAKSKKAATVADAKKTSDKVAAAVTESADSSASSAKTDASINQSVTTAEQTGAAKKSAWAGSMTMIAERGYQDPKDTQLSDVDTQLHLKASFARENGHKVTLNQRLFYSHTVNPNKQSLGDVAFGSLRAEYSIPNKIGAGGVTILRLSLPTTGSAQESNDLLGWAVMPNLAWEINPKVSLSYSGYVGGAFYAGNRKSVPAWAQDLLRDGEYVQADIDKMMSANAASRAFVYVINGVAVSYALNDKLSISQSLGYSFGLKNMDNNFANFKRSTAAWEIGTELGYELNKNVSLSASISQQAADMKGAADLVTGKGINFDGYNFALYREEQTTLGVSGVVRF
jgi:hypothetical protein